ncbi:MAG TPA: hypothetical protein VGY54_17800, partial [Polyangiaceae bacterium]|nr:hypothetical protein [Polyangiaceae bacterium]
MGSTGSGVNYGPIGSTGSGVDYGPMGSSGALFGSIDSSVAIGDGWDAAIDTKDATPLDADRATPDSRPDANEDGASDATPLDAGHILLGTVVSPADAGGEQ